MRGHGRSLEDSSLGFALLVVQAKAQTRKREAVQLGAVFILARTKGVKVGPAIIQAGKHLAKTETNL